MAMSLIAQYPELKMIQTIAHRRGTSVYLIGGFLRDHCLGRSCQDMDFAVSSNAIAFARSFAKQIQGAFVLLDEEHGCARVAKKSKEGIHTYDFADYRAPTLKQDLRRRDFTINTLSADIQTVLHAHCWDEVIQDNNHGLKDLKSCRIRMVSARAFQEDPLRLLRAYSLRAQLNFIIEKETLNRIRREKDRIRSVSYERIRDELFKILESPRAAETLRAMDRIGLLPCIIPQITVMYGIKQGTYHHLDVWRHSLEAIAQVEGIFAQLKEQEGELQVYLQEPLGGQRTRRALIKLGLLLHDVGKPQTLKREKGRISFHGHERVGKNITRAVAKLLKLSTQERHILEDMVLWHLRPGYLSNFKHPSEKAIFRFLRDTGEEAAGIALLSWADQRATCGPATTAADQRHHQTICWDLVTRFFAKKKEKPFTRLINGDDLIQQLQLKPSPLFARILQEVEEQQVTGQIRTKAQAIDLARQLAQQTTS
jgi:tRNA nucleotidyltransferase/poly(A) polymerase